MQSARDRVVTILVMNADNDEFGTTRLVQMIVLQYAGFIYGREFISLTNVSSEDYRITKNGNTAAIVMEHR